MSVFETFRRSVCIWRQIWPPVLKRKGWEGWKEKRISKQYISTKAHSAFLSSACLNETPARPQDTPKLPELKSWLYEKSLKVGLDAGIETAARSSWDASSGLVVFLNNSQIPWYAPMNHMKIVFCHSLSLSLSFLHPDISLRAGDCAASSHLRIIVTLFPVCHHNLYSWFWMQQQGSSFLGSIHLLPEDSHIRFQPRPPEGPYYTAHCTKSPSNTTQLNSTRPTLPPELLLSHWFSSYVLGSAAHTIFSYVCKTCHRCLLCWHWQSLGADGADVFSSDSSDVLIAEQF